MSKSQTITVTDTTGPKITDYPPGGALDCGIMPTDDEVKAKVTAMDDCGSVTIDVTHVDSGTFCEKIRTFEITATDDCKNFTKKTVVYTMDCRAFPGCFPPPPKPAAIGNFVWNDLNANGKQDVGEPGIAGAKVTLHLCSDMSQFGLAQTTGANGFYKFEQLTPGVAYYVQVVLPSG